MVKQANLRNVGIHIKRVWKKVKIKINSFLHDFKKCFEELGHHDFIEFHIVEAMPNSTKEERNLREDFYIKKYFDKQDRCYNFKKKSTSLPRSVFSNDPEATSKLLSEKGKAAWSNHKLRAKRMKTFRSEEFQKQQSKKQKQVSKNPAFGNSAEAHRKRYADPDFKKKHSAALRNAWVQDDGSRKKQASVLAREVYEANKEKIAAARLKAKAKYYGKVISPTGEVFEIYNAQEFIRKYNFSQSFYELLNGKLDKYKGWLRVR